MKNIFVLPLLLFSLDSFATVNCSVFIAKISTQQGGSKLLNHGFSCKSDAGEPALINNPAALTEYRSVEDAITQTEEFVNQNGERWQFNGASQIPYGYNLNFSK